MILSLKVTLAHYNDSNKLFWHHPPLPHYHHQSVTLRFQAVTTTMDQKGEIFKVCVLVSKIQSLPKDQKPNMAGPALKSPTKDLAGENVVSLSVQLGTWKLLYKHKCQSPDGTTKTQESGGLLGKALSTHWRVVMVIMGCSK